MLPEGVLSTVIRVDFWQPQKNDRKAELIKYWRQRVVLDRMNIQISKQLHTTMSRPFYSDAKKAKNVSFFFLILLLFLLFVTLFISTRFLRNYCRYKHNNTPPEPSRPTDVPFVGYKTESKDLGVFLAAKSIFTIVAPSSEWKLE